MSNVINLVERKYAKMTENNNKSSNAVINEILTLLMLQSSKQSLGSLLATVNASVLALLYQNAIGKGVDIDTAYKGIKKEYKSVVDTSSETFDQFVADRKVD